MISLFTGAGDNAVSCSVMLEILRALSHSDHKLRHGIIFLFNGAEENVLQASHGFITQHPWASTIKAFVNLDSAGAGGWEIVFQTGPEHPWLVRAYAEAAHYPFASVLGQELFQAGIIPSDTDFRIFRDFGKIPGLDIAHVANGYVYHTLNDKTDYIPEGCIQRAGENIMNLLKELASNPKLADPGLDKHGAMVFFDFVGYFMIHYPQRIGNILNCVVVGFAFLSVYMKISKRQSQVASSLQHIKYIIGAMMVIFGSWMVTFVAVIIFGLLLSFAGYSLFWYTNTYNILTVYIMPGLIIVLSIHDSIKEKYLKQFEPWYIESVFFDASLLIWSLFVIILTYLGVGSAALIMFWVFGPVILREAAFQVFEKSIYECHIS
ncbi:hypothetical protein KUTeg_016583 [Tegillarca granosa]|uniref:Peptidase M28 domain-containing protein n=1 Tax=Tegillarca granosa TaxID=220873 RepID=A0ABQ9ELB0_TEGGR|nr:hypothetical protein KUTeg_016583 [Tegillarca granosa]